MRQLALLFGAGGYAGARLGRPLPPVAVRWAIVAISFTITAVFFQRAGWL